MRYARYGRGRQTEARHEGSEHYFCSSRCLDKFEIDPELYLSRAHLDAVEDLPTGMIYTCPMHPEIRSTEGHSERYFIE
ncbi:MAG: YHS domain-containing protein [Citromicrobium sp.]